MDNHIITVQVGQNKEIIHNHNIPRSTTEGKLLNAAAAAAAANPVIATLAQ